mmetsp:Transcript_42104/g.95125  ORF Transcript_42104/g.95125 Transcript_42104/m.95125 type:complete len:90 (-) Transcript_42104:736-1005(-)
MAPTDNSAHNSDTAKSHRCTIVHKTQVTSHKTEQTKVKRARGKLRGVCRTHTRLTTPVSSRDGSTGQHCEPDRRVHLAQLTLYSRKRVL